ncbi:sugar phosphate isomerase/epimerase family protein [Cohnella sp.]|uniref:sugar phosphate isomerase/epimerase family protein n=1 Tax=Cohnella sp. TaxID=1883426 RepID=UPI0035683B5C
MRVRGIGVSLPPTDTVNNLDKLKSKLTRARELGFEAIELSLHGMDVIRNGVIDYPRLEKYKSVLHAFDLSYTTHAPYSINLFRQDDPDMEKASLAASLEVSGAIGAETMVYHVGRYIGEEEFLYPNRWISYTNEEKQRLLLYERLILAEMSHRAKQLNVRIAMENMRPYLDNAEYCYSVIPSALAEQVEAINHPSIGITLDIGHLYLSHKLYGLDLIGELKRMAPHIIHLHVHDNFGKACYSAEKNQYELAPLGRGDMHMPIGFGEIPMESIFNELSADFDGYLIHELRERYEGEWPHLRQRTETVTGGNYHLQTGRG